MQNPSASLQHILEIFILFLVMLSLEELAEESYTCKEPRKPTPFLIFFLPNWCILAVSWLFIFFNFSRHLASYFFKKLILTLIKA